jgi:hypothetical protein
MIEQLVDENKSVILSSSTWKIGKNQFFNNDWNKVLEIMKGSHCQAI